MIHLYIGNGKGKTTAAAGLAVRALGRGLKVLFAQFLKNRDTGEKLFLEKFPDMLFFRPDQRHHVFLWNMTEEQLNDTKEDILKGWLSLKGEIFSKHWDVVILDEILDVIHNGLILESEVLELIINTPSGVEIVCTGRDASGIFREKSDYITHMEAVKHPYCIGIAARRGIEY